jgi:cell cycle checkpoint control protein RAD9A
MSFPLDLHFTDPASPLFIDIESENSETLFVISTSQVGANAGVPSQAQSNTGHDLGSVNRKRMRQDDNENGNEDDNHNTEDGPSTHGPVPRSRPKEKERIKKPMKVVQRVNPTSVALTLANSSRPGTVRGSMPPPNSIPFRPLSQTPVFSQISNKNNGRDPLFLPGSQLSVADEEAIRDSGLGIESMGADELEALLEGDGEEVAFDFGSQRGMSQMNSGEHDGDTNIDDAMEGEEERGAGDSFDVIEDTEMEATQAEGAKVFVPSNLIILFRHLLTSICA